MQNSLVILFHSTNYVIWAKEVFSLKGIKCKMISVPRNLSSDCGYCLKVEDLEVSEASMIMENTRIEFESIIEENRLS